MLRNVFLLGLALLLAKNVCSQTVPARPAPPVQGAWMNRQLPAESRAALVLKELTLDEKLTMVHGVKCADIYPAELLKQCRFTAVGLMHGVPRLGIPDIDMADSAVGVRIVDTAESRYATLLPSTLALASSWDTDAGTRYGVLIGHEARLLGYNQSIGGGVDLLREPRNGRNFEYAGEDPLLAGTMVGTMEQGVLSQHVMNDIKHYAMNDEETLRREHNAVIGEKAMRESDLLAFEIALEIAKPSSVMCAYNKVNGDWSCENDFLLNKVLKQEFHYQGFVLSDWQGTHSTVKAALAGLDMEMPSGKYFGALGEAIAAGQVPMARLDDMVLRILRSMFDAGVVDDPPVPNIIDPFAGRDVAQKIAEESLVLLRNESGVLPLSPAGKRIAIIGGHADVGVMIGGGSGTVHPPEGGPIKPTGAGTSNRRIMYFPSSPLLEMQRHAPGANVTFDEGTDPATAARSAAGADVAIVFVTQHMSEGVDATTLALPDNQDALVEAVARANPKTIVVLETGGPVAMPWKDNVAGIVEAWYPGAGGAQALANLMFGTVNFSAKLAATFAKNDADLPRPVLPHSAKIIPASGPGKPETGDPFDIDYFEGARVGYKWFESEGKTPLFPFGFGLSYTTFAYSALKVDAKNLTATFTVKNTGLREGTEIAEFYTQLPSAAGEKFRRLIGWQRVDLQPGESKTVTTVIDRRMLSVFDVATDAWAMPHGDFTVFAGGSSEDLPLHVEIKQ